jgi:hypothetical protein
MPPIICAPIDGQVGQPRAQPVPLPGPAERR